MLPVIIIVNMKTRVPTLFIINHNEKTMFMNIIAIAILGCSALFLVASALLARK